MPKRDNAPKVARNREASIAGQGTVVARLTHERDEALLRETANSEILRLISKSRGDLELVFRTILEDATRICNAKFGTLFRFDGENHYPVAQFNTPKALLKAYKRRGPFKPRTGTPIDRITRTKQVIHSADDAAEPAPGLAAELGGARTQVTVPMLKDDALIGAIVIYRQEIRPFTEKQIGLVKNFAAQAVIAIENARLLNELRERTTDLAESLEQQTATADVLRVISSSPGELQRVFGAMVGNAVRICDAKFATVFLYDGNALRLVASHNVPSALVEARRSDPTPPPPGGPLHEIIRTKQTVHVVDLATSQPYRERNPFTVTSVEASGMRTVVVVPMPRDTRAIRTQSAGAEPCPA